MKSRIEGFSRFQDAEGDMNELAHHSADNELRRLAGAGQAVFKALAPSGLIERDHSRHIQRLAQESMADLG